MISDELKKIISTFESQGVMNFLDPASEEQISQFEKKNGIRLPEKYRDKLVTLRHHNWVYYSYYPVFDTDTQEIWDKEYHDYMQRKQEWCDKYGCD